MILYKKYIVRYEDITYRSDDRRIGYLYPELLYNKVEGNEYIIVCGKDDKHQPVIRKVEISYLLTLDTVAYADRIIQLVNDKELRISMEEKS